MKKRSIFDELEEKLSERDDSGGSYGASGTQEQLEVGEPADVDPDVIREMLQENRSSLVERSKTFQQRAAELNKKYFG